MTHASALSSAVALVSKRMRVPREAIEARSGKVYRFPLPEVALARRTAIYLASCLHDIGPRPLARAARMSPEGVRKACAAIEDRRDDPGFDRFIDSLAEELVAA